MTSRDVAGDARVRARLLKSINKRRVELGGAFIGAGYGRGTKMMGGMAGSHCSCKTGRCKKCSGGAMVGAGRRKRCKTVTKCVGGMVGGKARKKRSAWNQHVSMVARKNPGLAFGQAVKRAKLTYKRR